MFGILFVNVAAVMAAILVILFVFNQVREFNYDSQRYAYFAIRDKLYRYAIEGKIDRNSIAYKMTDSVISRSISAAKTYDIMTLVSILKDMGDCDSDMKKQRESVVGMIKQNEFVVEIYKDYTDATLSIIRQNSLVVKILLYVFRVRRGVRRAFAGSMKNEIELTFSPRYEVTLNKVQPYSVYKGFRHLQERLV